MLMRCSAGVARMKMKHARSGGQAYGSEHGGGVGTGRYILEWRYLILIDSTLGGRS